MVEVLILEYSRDLMSKSKQRKTDQTTRIPTYADLLWPTLQILQTRGGSASIRELEESIASSLGISEEVLEILHGDKPQSEVNYRAAWARTQLRLIGAVENTARGVWAITDYGRSIANEGKLRDLDKKQRTNQRTERPRGTTGTNTDGDHDETVERTWQDDLLDALKSMGTGAFERLCQRLLRESGFTKVEVTGRSGDGGIDGAGVLRVNLLSFHVRFQCKRYSGSVGSAGST